MIFWLMGVNVVVFVAWTQARGTLLDGLMVQHFLVGVESLASYRVWTLLTSAFSHYDASHLLFNMFALYVFGRAVAPVIGWRDVLQVYVVGGIVASLGHVAYGLITGDTTPALGASGSVMAFAVLYGALFPNRTLLLGFFLPVPAAVGVGGYILLDVMGAFAGGTGIAHAAHLAGGAYGLFYWWQRSR